MSIDNYIIIIALRLYDVAEYCQKHEMIRLARKGCVSDPSRCQGRLPRHLRREQRIVFLGVRRQINLNVKSKRQHRYSAFEMSMFLHACAWVCISELYLCVYGAYV